MIFDNFRSKDQQYRVLYNNTLANIHTALYRVQNTPTAWEEKMKAIEQISSLLPILMRMLIYFKNKETSGK